MKLQVLNDLHIEFEDFDPPATEADVVILAGDIGVGLEGLRWAEDWFPDRPVIYVPGNHEFYHHDLVLIDELKAQAPGLLGSQAVKWNFTKFLVGKDGQVLKRYAPNDTPESLRKDIDAALAA